MKEGTTLNSKFTEPEVKKENTFSRSPNFDFTCIHFNIYECLKWMERIPRRSVKMVFLTVSENSQEIIYDGDFN